LRQDQELPLGQEQEPLGHELVRSGLEKELCWHWSLPAPFPVCQYLFQCQSQCQLVLGQAGLELELELQCRAIRHRRRHLQ
jgi:hypothetical protein